jgi:hypothetical protein
MKSIWVGVVALTDFSEGSSLHGRGLSTGRLVAVGVLVEVPAGVLAGVVVVAVPVSVGV